MQKPKPPRRGRPSRPSRSPPRRRPIYKDAKRQERTEWHRIQAWGKLGEYAAAFKKGSHICVEGELRSRDYESNGAKVRTYDIVANSIINLRAGQRNAEAPDPAEAAA